MSAGEGWAARLHLHFRRDGAHTRALDRHEGPLRVLKALHPEGPAICHHVMVHPPGGIVGGDRLDVQVRLDPGTHALLTTPGATRYYRSAGAPATQSVQIAAGAGARLEWLPLETIAQRGCRAESRLQMQLDGDAQVLGWDVLALGLPASGEPFDDGEFRQHLELPGCWLERGAVRGDDAPLLDSPLGWCGQRVLGTLWFAAGRAWPDALRDALVDAAREQLGEAQAGVTAAHPQVIVLRVLAARVEPALRLLRSVRAVWRERAWGLRDVSPRVWST